MSEFDRTVGKLKAVEIMNMLWKRATQQAFSSKTIKGEIEKEKDHKPKFPKRKSL